MIAEFLPVLPGQAAQVAPLLATATHGRKWSAADIRRLQPPRGIVLADRDRTRCLALVALAAAEAEILDVGVHPDARAQGLGCALLTEVEAAAARLGARRMMLEVATDNAPARALYARAGYARIGQRPGYYRRPDGSRADALVLARDLTPVAEADG